MTETGQSDGAPLGSGPVGADGQAEYDRLCAYTLGRGDPRFIHQHVVDVWAAQHATERTKAITLTFALVGLYLHVDHGLTGRQVQRAHMRLARHKTEWPSIVLPPARGSITVTNVVTEPPGPARDAMIDAWCASVWRAYHDSHRGIAEWLRRRGYEPR